MRAPSFRMFSAALLCGVLACGVTLSAVAGGGPDCQSKMTRMDVEGNMDGQITAAAHAEGADERFRKMDANADGRITAEEIGASHGAESAAWATKKISNAEKIRQLDSDRDGTLSRAEYAEGSRKMFEKLDRDGDGLLTASEMLADTRVTARWSR